MRRATGVIVLLVMALIGAALFVPFLLRARGQAERARCQEHLFRLAMQGLVAAAKPDNAFPAGTIVVKDLPPERRLSWIPPLLLLFGRDDLRNSLDLAAAWDAVPNQAVSQKQLTLAMCPGIEPRMRSEGFAPLNYVGCGGVGAQGPTLDPEAPGAGIFRYDNPTPFAAVKDGLSHTILLLETADRPGPWLAGGPASVRPLDPATQPYIGIGRPFGGCHLGGLNVAFADGSARFLDASINPHIFQQLAAIADGSQ
jgi:prepilin-type processing-associated H-X9-DG protein